MLPHALATLVLIVYMFFILHRFSPIGIASIVAGKLMEVDDVGGLFANLGFYMLTVLLGLFIHGFFTLPFIYLVIARRNPLKLYKGMLQALLVAFSISSRCGCARVHVCVCVCACVCLCVCVCSVCVFVCVCSVCVCSVCV